jgi:hypothetical protein
LSNGHSAGLALLFVLLVAGSCANHRWQTLREKAACSPPGQMIAVNGYRWHAYAVAGGGEYSMIDVGHYVHSEAPDLVAAETRDFLQRIR